jgi:hypothetical protein
MLKQVRPFIAVVCGLGVMAAVLPARAAQVTLLLDGTGGKDPFVVAFADGANGEISLDKDTGQRVHDKLAGVHYVIADNGQLLVGSLNGTELTDVLPAGAALSVSKDNSYFVIHSRSADRRTFVDGELFRLTSDPSKGLAIFTLTLFDSQGNSRSVHVEQDLTFAASNGGGNNGGNGGNGGNNNGGFGNF